MDVPQGFMIKGEFPAFSRLVCKLHKSIYGLKQASQQWNMKFTQFMESIGFEQSKADYSFFHKGHGDTFVALLVYVDDIIITRASYSAIKRLKEQLCQAFKLKYLGDLGYFLGLEIACSKNGISVSQRRYALQLLEDAGLLAAKPVFVPMDPNVVLNELHGDLIDDPTQYRRLVGRLMYLTITRSDITFVVHKLARFMSKPRVSHMNVARYLLRYLKQQPRTGIFY